MGTPTLHVRAGNPDFLDLPWEKPLNSWVSDRVVEMPSGIHRHPVAFVAYESGVYVVKELTRRLAENEFRVLRALEEESSRTAEPVALVTRDWMDPHDEGAGVVITRYVEHSFPYRRLISGTSFGARREQMLDALAGLLVELHMAGCYWGDCSLSNVLCRFDAGQLESVMIDAETSELHPSLSSGQREQDLEIMRLNVAGEMGDIAAESGEDIDAADIDLGSDVSARYEALWDELNRELVVSKDDAYLIRARIARINDLGFSVEDMEILPTDKGGVLRLRVNVGGRTFNSDSLRERTGIEASEEQARLILSDLNYHLAKSGELTSTGKSVGTFKWLTGVFEPLVARIKEDWHGEDPVQGYCDFLNHRYQLAKDRRSDVADEEAYESWAAGGFPGFEP